MVCSPVSGWIIPPLGGCLRGGPLFRVEHGQQSPTRDRGCRNEYAAEAPRHRQWNCGEMKSTALPRIECGEWRSAGGFVWWEARIGSASLTFTTRVGGASSPPCDTLNLGLHVGDTPALVIDNRRLFWSAVT